MFIIRKSLVVLAASGAFACSHLNESEREQERQAAAGQMQQDPQDPRARSTSRPLTQARKGTVSTRRQPEAGVVEKQKEEVGEKPRAADNTGINERDRDAVRKTPIDQGNSAEDIRITADIRKAVMKESELSFTAKNVKIITQGAHVYLRGPVKNAIEKQRIDAIARGAAGVLNVDDQLEVEFQPNY